MSKSIVIAGGSGCVGKIFTAYFTAKGYEVFVFSRTRIAIAKRVRWISWDGRTVGPWSEHLDSATAVINLAGRSVNCRYTAKNRREMMDSRIFSTKVLGAAIARCAHPPRVWLNASTATIYKHSFEKPMDENGEIGATPEAKDAFSVEIARAWQRAFDDAKTPATRKISLRMAMVLAPLENSVYPVLRRLVKTGLGGTMASGRQFVSWIHEHDLCRAIEWLIENEAFSGHVNLAAPHPLPNREMMQTLRRVLRMPFGLPAAEWMLELGAIVLRTETELIIKSRRVVPKRLIDCGFSFKYRTFEDAAREIETRISP
jgi:uncharacterized protein (TIGR01777 family)